MPLIICEPPYYGKAENKEIWEKFTEFFYVFWLVS